MGRLLGFGLVASGLAIAGLAWMPSGEKQASQQLASLVRIASEGARPDRAETTVRASAPDAAAAPMRTFSPDRPMMSPSAQPVTSQPHAEIPVRTAERPVADPRQRDYPAASPAAPLPDTPARPDGPRLTSVKPGDDASKHALTRSIQAELTRVGCFDGDADGTWSSATRRAMKTFTERVNASLPTEEPDYILLTLLQGHAARACGKACPVGQALSNDGRCEPRAILAQRDPNAKPKAPLPGRMAAGAPVTPETAPTVAEADLRARADAEARRRNEIANREAAARAEAERTAKAESERTAKADADQRAKASADARRAEETAKAEAERKAMADAEQRAKAVADARRTEETAKAVGDAESRARLDAEWRAKASADARRAEDIAKAKTAEADAKAAARKTPDGSEAQQRMAALATIAPVAVEPTQPRIINPPPASAVPAPPPPLAAVQPVPSPPIQPRQQWEPTSPAQPSVAPPAPAPKRVEAPRRQPPDPVPQRQVERRASPPSRSPTPRYVGAFVPPSSRQVIIYRGSPAPRPVTVVRSPSPVAAFRGNVFHNLQRSAP